MTEPTNKLKPSDYESLIKELGVILQKLEEGSLPLEEAVQQYERGMQLTQEAQKILDTAEQKIQILTSTEQGETLEPAQNDEES